MHAVSAVLTSALATQHATKPEQSSGACVSYLNRLAGAGGYRTGERRALSTEDVGAAVADAAGLYLAGGAGGEGGVASEFAGGRRMNCQGSGEKDGVNELHWLQTSDRWGSVLSGIFSPCVV